MVPVCISVASCCNACAADVSACLMSPSRIAGKRCSSEKAAKEPGSSVVRQAGEAIGEWEGMSDILESCN